MAALVRVMEGPRVVFEADYSVERLRLQARGRQTTEISSHTDYVILHFHGSADVIFAEPRQALQLGNIPSSRDLLTLRISPRLLVETAARLRLLRAGSHLTLRSTLKEVRDARLTEMLESIEREIKAADSGWREIVDALVRQISIHVLRNHANIERSDAIELSRVGMVDRRLRRAIEFMHDNCQHDLQLADIARAAYLSTFHFAHLFKSLTGTTPRAYLASIRIERARRLLAETDLAINEVAAQVGYESQSHFTNVFKEATGMTPRAFRKACNTGV